MARWTRSAIQEDTKESEGKGADCVKETAEYIRKKLLLKKLLNVTGVGGTVTEDDFTEAMEALYKIISVKNHIKEGAKVDVGYCMGAEEGRPKRCPQRRIRKGRPRSKP